MYTDEDRREHMERQRRLHMAEVKKHRRFIKNVLRPIKEKLERDGEGSLTAKERVIVDTRRAYFFPEEG